MWFFWTKYFIGYQIERQDQNNDWKSRDDSKQPFINHFFDEWSWDVERNDGGYIPFPKDSTSPETDRRVSKQILNDVIVKENYTGNDS